MEQITVSRPPTTPSNLLRRLLCPGSAFMEAGLPDHDSIDARIGRLFHRYWFNETLDRTFLSDDERDLLELSDRLLRDVLNRLSFEMGEKFFVEQTLSATSVKLTGTPDRVHWWQQRDSALVADLKSGFAVVERAELNLQLRGYAVLVADALLVKHVYVSILQPRLWSPSERITLAHYEPDDIKQARDQINAIVAATEEPDAPLHAGEEQCRFCRARLTCPAFREAMALPLAAFESEEKLSKTKREAVIAQRVKDCSDEQLERVIEACKLAAFVEEPSRDEARTRIEAGGFTNYTLGKEWEARTITNVRRAIAMLALADVASREEILGICKIPLKELENVYRDRTKTTWQQSRDKINRVLASVIEREPRKPKILRK